MLKQFFFSLHLSFFIITLNARVFFLENKNKISREDLFLFRKKIIQKQNTKF